MVVLKHQFCIVCITIQYDRFQQDLFNRINLIYDLIQLNVPIQVIELFEPRQVFDFREKVEQAIHIKNRLFPRTGNSWSRRRTYSYFRVLLLVPLILSDPSPVPVWEKEVCIPAQKLLRTRYEEYSYISLVVRAVLNEERKLGQIIRLTAQQTTTEYKNCTDIGTMTVFPHWVVKFFVLWEVLNAWYVTVMRVSDAAETVTALGSLNLNVPMITRWVLRSVPNISKRYLQFTSLLMYCTIYIVG